MLRLGKDGGRPTLLTDAPVQPWALAVDDTHVYYTDSLSGVLARVPRGR